METTDYPQELVEYLVRSSRLEPREAQNLIAEVLRYYSESHDEFICRRHHALQRQGLSNAAIYKAIQVELDECRFPAPALSERQIRRIIYG